jgi:hypothetical protein
MKDRSLAAVVLVFLIAFLWQLAEVFSKHACYCDFLTPVATADVIRALVFGLGAIAAALGVNVSNLVQGLTTNQGAVTDDIFKEIRRGRPERHRDRDGFRPDGAGDVPRAVERDSNGER